MVDFPLDFLVVESVQLTGALSERDVMTELLILQSKTPRLVDASSTKKSVFFWPEILLLGVADGVVAAVLSDKQRDPFDCRSGQAVASN